jgi:hypothetical protein
MVTRGADEFRTLGSLEGEEEVFDVAVLAEKTEATTHEIGLEVIFSPLDVRPGSFSGRVWEVRARYQKAFAGSGGRTPKGARFEAALRMFISLWGSN